MQPVEASHDRKVSFRYRTWQVVNTATADAQDLRLLCDRKIMLTVDHRFALSNPALVSSGRPTALRSASAACSNTPSTSLIARAWRSSGAGSSACWRPRLQIPSGRSAASTFWHPRRSEEHTSELQSQFHLVCRLL